MTTKQCRMCGELKPVTDFYTNHAKCKPCQRVHEKSNPSREPAYRAAARRRQQLHREYDISPADYTVMVLAQDGQCAICHDVPKVLHVDHDHVTGAVRQLLCRHCNLALGHLRDNPHLLARAADYLKEHQSA